MNQSTFGTRTRHAGQTLLLGVTILFGMQGCGDADLSTGKSQVSGPVPSDSSSLVLSAPVPDKEGAPRLVDVTRSSEIVLPNRTGSFDLRSLMIQDETGRRSLAERIGKTSIDLTGTPGDHLYVSQAGPAQLSCGAEPAEESASCSMKRQLSSNPDPSAVYCCHLIGCTPTRCYWRCTPC